MASDEIYEFTVTTPAGTLQASPLTTPTVFPSRIVRRIEWRVPAGAAGFMGWQISSSKVPIIPRNAGAFIVSHETSGGWDIANQPDSGDWQVKTFNTGTHPHALYVIYHCDVIRPAELPLELLDLAQLGAAPSPDWTGAAYGT